MESLIKYLKMYLFGVVVLATTFLEGASHQDHSDDIEKVSYVFNFPGKEISGDVISSLDSMHFLYAFEGDWTPLEMLSGLTRDEQLFSMKDAIESEDNKALTVQYWSQIYGLCFEGRVLYSSLGEKLEEEVFYSNQASFFDGEGSALTIPSEEITYPMTITFLFDGGKMVEMDVQQVMELGEDPASLFQDILISNHFSFTLSDPQLFKEMNRQEYQSFLRDRKCGFWGDVFSDIYEGTCAFGRKAWEWIKENKEEVVKWCIEVLEGEDPKDKKKK